LSDQVSHPLYYYHHYIYIYIYIYICPFFNEYFPLFKLFSYPFGNCWHTRAKSTFQILLFNVDFQCKNCPSARCVWAANVIGSGTDILNGRSLSVSMIG
jgi:hypothetical protein